MEQASSRKIAVYVILGVIAFGAISYLVYAKETGGSLFKSIKPENSVSSPSQTSSASPGSNPASSGTNRQGSESMAQTAPQPAPSGTTSNKSPSQTPSAKQPAPQPSQAPAAPATEPQAPDLVSLPATLPTNPTAPATAVTSDQVTLHGLVMGKTSNTSFVLQIDGKNYTVVMDNFGGTQVVNLLGHLVPWQFIQVGNSITVTGSISGSTLTAKTVVVATSKDT